VPGPQVSGTHVRHLDVREVVLVRQESVEVVPPLGEHLRCLVMLDMTPAITFLVLEWVVNGYDAVFSGVRYACKTTAGARPRTPGVCGGSAAAGRTPTNFGDGRYDTIITFLVLDWGCK